MARRRQRWTLAALLLHPASGFYALSRHNTARTVLRSSSSDPAENDDTPVPVQKALAAMTAFSNRYVKVSGTKYCSEPSVPAVVIRGLAEHKAALGAPLCPCRNYVDKEAEAKSGYWNCPCVPMREPAWKSTPSSGRRMEATSRRWRGS
jgi:ferredoxin-thioredoxin reductase catalytic subunit